MNIYAKSHFIAFVKNPGMCCTKAKVGRYKVFLFGIIGITDFRAEISQRYTKIPAFPTFI